MSFSLEKSNEDATCPQKKLKLLTHCSNHFKNITKQMILIINDQTRKLRPEEISLFPVFSENQSESFMIESDVFLMDAFGHLINMII